MDDRHAPKLYARFLLGLLKKAQKILAKGSSASSASSPASTAAMNGTSSSPAANPRDFPSSGMSNSYMPNSSSASSNPGSFAQFQPVQGDAGTQTSYAPTGANTAETFNMEGVQNVLPQNNWPYGVVNPGEGDTLMTMQLFGDQFWEDSLVSGLFLVSPSCIC